MEAPPARSGEGVTPPLTGRRILLGVSAGIAAYKAAPLARLLVGADADVRVVLTRGATRLVGAATFEGLTANPVRTGVWEDVPGQTHVDLARWADAVLVYPATAHLMARAATGLADDLLTTSLLAATCPVVMAPAMHAEMWHHPATAANADTLRDRGVLLVGPAEGKLMGGDRGPGRAVEPAEAVEALVGTLRSGEDLAGRRIVVTAGGTREPLDPVRFLGNRSSGRMGFALARAAVRRGAEVVLVAAPTELPTPPGVTRRDVTTALQMRDAVLEVAADADAVIKAAAVADFRPADPHAEKIRKRDVGDRLTLELVRNPDILAELGRRREADRPVLVGFAAETSPAEEGPRRKLTDKHVDLLVVNDVTRADAGFGSTHNAVVILRADGGRTCVPLSPKPDVAHRVLDEVLALLS